MDAPERGSEPETEAPAEPGDAAYWEQLIRDSEECMREYQEAAKEIEAEYAKLSALNMKSRSREMQVFWANLEVLKPAVYARAPVPVVIPRFKDRKPLSRQAAELLERCAVSVADLELLDDLMQMVRDNLVVTGRGCGWVRYFAEKGEDGLLDERVILDHVDREDFAHDPARKWREVEWVGRRSWLSKDAMRARFEKTNPDWATAQFQTSKGKDENYKGEAKAAVWEIWHKTSKKVVWISPGMEKVLDEQAPPLTLPKFFPCPEPAFATKEPGTLKPVPDYVYYRDQLLEIDALTEKIGALTDGLVLRGFYSSGGGDLTAAIETAFRQKDPGAVLIPVANLGAVGSAGVKDSVIWLPITDVVQALQASVEARKLLISDVYEITGLSDIMRGSTEASETLGAQQLKSQYGSVRIRQKQTELVRFAKEMVELISEVIAENFQPASMQAMAQMDDLPMRADIEKQVMQIEQGFQSKVMQAQQSPQGQQMLATPEGQQQAQQLLQQETAKKDEEVAKVKETVTLEDVHELLRSQRMRPFVLDIETDSTIVPDEMAAKQGVTEFGAMLGGLLPQIMAMVGAEPQTTDFAGELLKFMSAPFRAGRGLEAAIDGLIEISKDKAEQPKQPTPEEKKIEGQMALEKEKATNAKAKTDQEMAQSSQKHAAEMQKLQAEGERARTRFDEEQRQGGIQREHENLMRMRDGEESERNHTRAKETHEFKLRETGAQKEPAGPDVMKIIEEIAATLDERLDRIEASLAAPQPGEQMGA
jgi:hypothetical protein